MRVARGWWTMVLIAALWLAGCAPQRTPTPTSAPPASPTVAPTRPAAGQPTASPEPTCEPGFTERLANVERIEVLIRESQPVQVGVRVVGYLNDACTQISRWTQDVEGQRIVVRLYTRRPTDAVCAQVIVPFEENITLDISELEPGTYTVEVNGVTETLTLEPGMLQRPE